MLSRRALEALAVVLLSKDLLISASIAEGFVEAKYWVRDELAKPPAGTPGNAP